MPLRVFVYLICIAAEGVPLRFDALSITLGTRPEGSECASLTYDLSVVSGGLTDFD